MNASEKLMKAVIEKDSFICVKFDATFNRYTPFKGRDLERRLNKFAVGTLHAARDHAAAVRINRQSYIEHGDIGRGALAYLIDCMRNLGVIAIHDVGVPESGITAESLTREWESFALPASRKRRGFDWIEARFAAGDERIDWIADWAEVYDLGLFVSLHDDTFFQSELVHGLPGCLGLRIDAKGGCEGLDALYGSLRGRWLMIDEQGVQPTSLFGMDELNIVVDPGRLASVDTWIAELLMDSSVYSLVDVIEKATVQEKERINCLRGLKNGKRRDACSTE